MLMCPLCGKTNLKNILAHYKIHIKDVSYITDYDIKIFG